MAEPSDTPPSGDKGLWPDWLTPRRAWEFARNVFQLEESVGALRVENRLLREELIVMQKAVADHDAQLRLLTTFVRDSLSNRLETRIEKLAAELLAKRGKDDS